MHAHGCLKPICIFARYRQKSKVVLVETGILGVEDFRAGISNSSVYRIKQMIWNVNQPVYIHFQGLVSSIVWSLIFCQSHILGKYWYVKIIVYFCQNLRGFLPILFETVVLSVPLEVSCFDGDRDIVISFLFSLSFFWGAGGNRRSATALAWQCHDNW